jgi:molybdate transport system substrate-binding protein
VLDDLVRGDAPRPAHEQARGDGHQREVVLEAAPGDAVALLRVDARDRDGLRHQDRHRGRAGGDAEDRADPGERLGHARRQRPRRPGPEPELLEHLRRLARALAPQLRRAVVDPLSGSMLGTRHRRGKRAPVDPPVGFWLPAPMARLLALSLAAWALAAAPRAFADSLDVAAAADLRPALDELVRAFRAEHPGLDVRVSYGASGTLAAQIGRGAPFDLFFSADERYPRTLVDSGAAVAESLTRYATGHLALWIPSGAPVEPDASLAALKDPRVRRVAIANPAHAPYGRAAEEALRAAGILDAVRPRLVLGESVAQAAQFAESGNADAALLPLSIALTPALRRAGRHVAVAPSLDPGIAQAAVVTQRGRRNVAATALLRFAIGPAGRDILRQRGFGAPRR